jgi:DNA polymerase III delta prime subunit
MSNNQTEEQKIAYITSIINQYLQLENEIKELQKAVKERKYKHKLLEESILTFMNEDGSVDSIKLSNNDHEIFPVQREQVSEVSRKNLLEIIETHLKDTPEVLDKIKADMDAKKTTKKVEKIKVKKASSSKLAKDSKTSDALLGL